MSSWYHNLALIQVILMLNWALSCCCHKVILIAFNSTHCWLSDPGLISTGPMFPKDYPTGCLLGCVNVTDCLSQQQFREQVSERCTFTTKKKTNQKVKLSGFTTLNVFLMTDWYYGFCLKSVVGSQKHEMSATGLKMTAFLSSFVLSCDLK